MSLSLPPPFPILCSSSCFFPSIFNFPALLYIHSFLPPAPPHFQISFACPSFIFLNLLSFCPSCPSLSYWLTTICLYFLLSPSSIFSLFISTHTLYFKMHFFYYHFPFWSSLFSCFHPIFPPSHFTLLNLFSFLIFSSTSPHSLLVLIPPVQFLLSLLHYLFPLFSVFLIFFHISVYPSVSLFIPPSFLLRPFLSIRHSQHRTRSS